MPILVITLQKIPATTFKIIPKLLSVAYKVLRDLASPLFPSLLLTNSPSAFIYTFAILYIFSFSSLLRLLTRETWCLFFFSFLAWDPLPWFTSYTSFRLLFTHPWSLCLVALLDPLLAVPFPHPFAFWRVSYWTVTGPLLISFPTCTVSGGQQPCLGHCWIPTSNLV